MEDSNPPVQSRSQTLLRPLANRRLAFLLGAVLIFLAGFVTGRALATRQLTAASPPVPPPQAAEIPTRDVTGADIDGLPRYPGAVRVEYRSVLAGDLMETEVEYVVTGSLDAVHDFYRGVFDEEGWMVADLGIYQGEWTFLVVSGEREAVVELEARESLIEIEIELSEPPVND